jgi:IS5 family transposase
LNLTTGSGCDGAIGFFDLSRRYEGLDVKDDPLVAIAAMISWESLRPKLKASLIIGGLRASDVARKSPAGRKPWNEMVIFKGLVLQALYNLSDDGEIPASRPPLVHAVSRPGTRGCGSRRQDLMALSRALAKAGAVEEL